MQTPQRKVVQELMKVWENVVAKGKVKPENRLTEVKSWILEHPAVSSIQKKVNQNLDKMNKIDLRNHMANDIVTDKTREKVGRLMKAYEELIGISEVRAAHARVLTTEAKFISCQEQRRLASKQLTEIQDKLFEIRAELDRTQRGNEVYLDLIRKEIDVTKAERVVRKQFEDLERTEREIFSQLSNALRFSHEKERAQNEKTKYWSIVGSVIGATLGVLGTTINNKMKQNHLKHVLGETSAQVASIQASVEELSRKVNSGTSVTPEAITGILTGLKEQQENLKKQHEVITKSMQDSVKTIQQVLLKVPSNQSSDLNLALQTQSAEDNDILTYLNEPKWHYTAILCCAVSTLLYKYF